MDHVTRSDLDGRTPVTYSLASSVNVSRASMGRVRVHNVESGRFIESGPDILFVIREFVQPTTISCALAKLAASWETPERDLSSAIRSLLEMGILESCDKANLRKSLPRHLVAPLEPHRFLLADRHRVWCWCEAIERTVNDGHFVIDVGAGLGILSLAAARAGAKRVVAIERSHLADLAKEIASDNNLSERIEFVQQDMRYVEFDQKADVVVCEFVGFPTFGDRVVEAFLDARDRLLDPKGTVIPEKQFVYFAPVSDANLDSSFGFGAWDSRVGGFDFSAVKKWGHSRAVSYVAKSYWQLLSAAQRMFEIDFMQATFDEFFFKRASSFRIEQNATLHGFVAYFSCQFCEEITLDSAPGTESSVWGQYFFPVHSMKCREGDIVDVELLTRPGRNPNVPRMQLSVKIASNGEVKFQDFANYEDIVRW